ncbi:hypothetical protein VP01_9608g1, partial [Puccinia sorghi]
MSSVAATAETCSYQLAFISSTPFLFAFQAGLCYDSAGREQILSMMDSRGVRFETTICKPASRNWEESSRVQVGKEDEQRGEKDEAHHLKRVFRSYP